MWRAGDTPGLHAGFISTVGAIGGQWTPRGCRDVGWLKGRASVQGVDQAEGQQGLRRDREATAQAGDGHRGRKPVPRCCGPVFYREACPGAIGERGSRLEGTPGCGVPKERQGRGFVRAGAWGGSCHLHQEKERGQHQGQDVRHRCWDTREAAPVGGGHRQLAEGRGEGGRGQPPEDDCGGG